MEDIIKLPTALSGVISKLEGLSFCMDGATHIIHTPIGIYRLKGRETKAVEALLKAADGSTKVTVMGYPVFGSECMYISVYHVSVTESVLISIQDIDLVPWPWLM